LSLTTAITPKTPPRRAGRCCPLEGQGVNCLHNGELACKSRLATGGGRRGALARRLLKEAGGRLEER